MSNGKIDSTPSTKVSRQEELLYGSYAGLVRRVGRAAEEADAAWRELEQLLTASMEADGITSGMTRPSVRLDERGHSPHTNWLLRVDDRVNALKQQSHDLLGQVSFEAIQQEANTRGVQLGSAGPLCS